MSQSQKFALQCPPRQGHSPLIEQSALQLTVPPHPSGAVPAHCFAGHAFGFGVQPH